jgi:uncharacterized membrane protein
MYTGKELIAVDRYQLLGGMTLIILAALFLSMLQYYSSILITIALMLVGIVLLATRKRKFI